MDLEEELSRASPEGVIGAESPTAPAGKGVSAEQQELIAEEAKALGETAKVSLTLADFDVLRVIGKGSFGKVFLVQKKGADGEFHPSFCI